MRPSMRHGTRRTRQHPEFHAALRRARGPQVHRVCHTDVQVARIRYHVANAVAEIIAQPVQGFGLRRRGWIVDAPQIATETA